MLEEKNRDEEIEAQELKKSQTFPLPIEAGPPPSFIFVPKMLQMVRMIGKALAECD